MSAPDVAGIVLRFGVDLQRWLSFTLAEAALSLAPGPAVALVVGTAIGRSLRQAIAAALGILGANLIFFALSAAGVGALVIATPLLFEVLKWGGVVVIAGLAIAAWTGRASPISLDAPMRGARERRGPAASFAAGLLLQLANPKALLSFIVVLPPFVDASRPVAPQMMVFAASSMLPELVILSGYAWLGRRAAPWLERPGYARATERFAAIVLLVAAAAMAIATSVPITR